MPSVQVHVSSTVGQAISALENKLMNADVALRHADGSRLVNAVKRMARRQSGRGQYSKVWGNYHAPWCSALDEANRAFGAHYQRVAGLLSHRMLIYKLLAGR
jgi:hypothetical protein